MVSDDFLDSLSNDSKEAESRIGESNSSKKSKTVFASLDYIPEVSTENPSTETSTIVTEISTINKNNQATSETPTSEITVMVLEKIKCSLNKEGGPKNFLIILSYKA